MYGRQVTPDTLLTWICDQTCATCSWVASLWCICNGQVGISTSCADLCNLETLLLGPGSHQSFLHRVITLTMFHLAGLADGIRLKLCCAALCHAALRYAMWCCSAKVCTSLKVCCTRCRHYSFHHRYTISSFWGSFSGTFWLVSTFQHAGGKQKGGRRPEDCCFDTLWAAPGSTP